MANNISVDRGVLFELLLAAEAVLGGEAETYLATTSAARLAEARDAAATIRDRLLG